MHPSGVSGVSESFVRELEKVGIASGRIWYRRWQSLVRKGWGSVKEQLNDDHFPMLRLSYR